MNDVLDDFFGSRNLRKKAEPVIALDMMGADVVVDRFLSVQRITLPAEAPAWQENDDD